MSIFFKIDVFSDDIVCEFLVGSHKRETRRYSINDFSSCFLNNRITTLMMVGYWPKHVAVVINFVVMHIGVRSHTQHTLLRSYVSG